MKISFFCLILLFISPSELLFCQEKAPDKAPKKSTNANSKKKKYSNDDFETLTTAELLKEDGKSNKNSESLSPGKKNRVSWGTYIQMFLVLVFILFLIFIFFFLSRGRLRKSFVGNNGIEVLARTSIVPKQSILILKVGPKLLIVNSHINGSMNTLTEFTKPEDIQMILQEIEKPSNDNIFQTLLKRNEVLYDEELAHPEKELDKLEKKVDQVEDKYEV